MVISLLIWSVFGLIILYLLVIGIITYGWFNLSGIDESNVLVTEERLSIVIAVRNESENIFNLLTQIIEQDYNSSFYDIIVVDDHSEDDTTAIVSRLIINCDEVEIKLIDAVGNGKKSALREGIALSDAKLIVTTDGDCKVNNGWLSSIVRYYNSTNKKVIIGPVVYEDSSSFLKKLFTLDFASLVASGAGSAGIGLPLMGNGANLAFDRGVIQEYYDKPDKYASGDDVFLIHHVAKKYGAGSIGFLKEEEAIVSTPAPDSLLGFLKQRIRWASKASGYKQIWPILVSITVFLFNMILFLMLVASFYFHWLLPIYFLLILTKYFIDMPLVYSFLTFTRKNNLKLFFLFQEFIYPIYIVVASILSFTVKYTWKNRKQLN